MMNEKNIPEAFFSLREAAEYMHIERQAVYAAIQKGRLKSKIVNRRHVITRKDVDEYRANKYNRDLRTMEGEPIFDLEKGHLSVNHVSKTIAAMLRRPYPVQHIYYLLRTGELKGFKKGGTWVISKDDAKALYEKEIQEDSRQMTFA